MSRYAVILAFAIPYYLSALESAKGDLAVTQWTLASVVDDFDHDQSSIERSDTVQNPFNEIQTAVVGNSFVSTAYDMSWAGDTGSFNVVSDHYMAQLAGEWLFSGRMFFSPSVDSVLTSSAFDAYDWPSSIIGQSSIGIGLVDLTEGIEMYAEAKYGGNVGLGPSHGTLTLSDVSLSLIGGHNYRFVFSARTDQDDPSPSGIFGTAHAEFHFNITPVPEPAPLGLIGVAFLARRRPRRST